MNKNTKTKQQLLLEIEELTTRLDVAQQRLQEADERMQAEITERKRAEEDFVRAQKHAESLVETIREPLLVLTADLKVVSANQSFYQTFKVTPEETEGRFIYSVGNHQWDIPALRKLLEEIVPQNSHFNGFEVDHEFPAIGRKTMLLNARRIYRQGQGTEMILLAIEDITERNQARKVLEVSETRYRRLFETAQDGILILDADTGQISDVNPFLTQMLGYSHEDFLGRQLWEIGAFRDIEASRTAFSELQTRGYVRYEDLPLQTRDGRFVDVEFVSNVYLVDHRKVIQCNIRNITERKKAEEKLRAREERYRSYIEVTGQLAWTTNTDGEVVEDIPVWRKFTGQSEEETKGAGWARALHPDDVKRTMEAWNNAVATKSAYEVEYRIRRYDGVYRHFLVHGVPVVKEDGSIREWVGTCVDITERKQIEDAQKFLVQCGLPASGEDFFKSLARYLAVNLGMDYVCIDRLQEEGLAAQTVAIYFDGKFEDNLTYALKDTPCGDVVEKTICCFPKGVRHLHPQDVVLQEMMAESYVGTILWSSKGQPIGLIAIIGRQPLANPQLAESMLKLVAVRAAGELERREAEEALQEKTHELGERVRELNCLYALSKVIERSDSSLPETFERSVNIIPPGWQYPEVTCARLVLENQTFKTPNFSETIWKQSSPILVDGRSVGTLEVYYLEEKPERDEGPFLKGERDLIDALAARLGKTIQRKRAEEGVRQRSLELQQLTETLEQRVLERTAELATTNEALRHLSKKLLSAQEDERRRIAGELHDTVGSCLTAIKFKVQAAQQESGNTVNFTGDTLNAIMPLVQESIDECRRIQMHLRPSMLDDLGLLPTLSWFFRRFGTIYSGIRVEQEIGLEEVEIPGGLKTVIYRVIQESMNNIAKHSKADSVNLSLRKLDDRLELVLQDNGRGFDQEKADSQKSTSRGLGLSSMRERVELSWGSFAIESTEGKGTIIRASWPLRGNG
jgi:PAS domain S-box-containing protein